MTKAIFCVDSDGCAINTMTFKHEVFMAPIAYEKFNLESVIDREDFMQDWMHVNLYTNFRGANRFKSLVNMLDRIGYPANYNALSKWVNEASQLSMTSLRQEIDKVGPDPSLVTALEWSQACNDGIHSYESEDYRAFDGVKESLAALAPHGPLYVVSTANKPNISAEWRDNDLDQYVSDYYCQEAGPKYDTLKGLVEAGNDSDYIIMIGDSPGDLEAAERAGVQFYPILVGQESQSWAHFVDQELENFLQGDYDSAYYGQVFRDHLSS